MVLYIPSFPLDKGVPFYFVPTGSRYSPMPPNQYHSCLTYGSLNDVQVARVLLLLTRAWKLLT